MEIVALIIPFIALALISVMADRITLVLQAIMKRIPRLPDQFEWWIAYFVVLGISYVVCMEGNFDLFRYLNINFSKPWEGWLLTALVLSGGSSFVKSQFNMIDTIPGVISGVTTAIKNMVVPNSKEQQQSKSLNEIDTPSTSSELSESGSTEIFKDSNRFTDDI
ncbi:MAG: hypothetical protein K0R18_480 [Bacillales bacterium]|jgi:hypothetical protein|nr:hypothetical protein [Bacillales bacterium]